jgi:DNA-binding MarR family transcriptional regulator
MAHFPRPFQYFASFGNTRYELGGRPARQVRVNARSPTNAGKARSFRLSRRFCNITTKYVNMADIIVSGKANVAGTTVADRTTAGGASTEPIWDIIELLFFAYRDFVGDPDEVLLKLGFGRAHHRVLHFVNRNPGIKVADLLEILNITKQSLGRVLKQLVDEGYVLQKEGAEDRRQRLLYATPKGETLALKLANLQTQRIGHAFDELGPNAHEAARRFLTSMIDADNREGVLRLIERAGRHRKRGAE